MTGAGAPGAPGIIQCLLQQNSVELTVADADENAIGRYLHPVFAVIPKAEDNNFVSVLLKICIERKIEFLLPLVTKELLPLAHNMQHFEEAGVKVLVSSAEAISLSNDKAACYAFLQANKIAVPKFFVVKTGEAFVAAAQALGYPRSAFCFKPSQSNGSRGFRIVDPYVDEVDLLFNQKPQNTHITYEKALAIFSAHSFPELLVMEYLPREEYSVDCISQHGEAKLVVPRVRKKMINGITVQGTFVHDDDVIQYCKTIIKTVKLHGNVGIQVKKNAYGAPVLLEINPRVQGTIVAAIGAGVNLPLLAVKQEAGIAITPEETSIRWGTHFSRYWTEVFY
jgi:carbamoyl-phosphate synthase large subunit